MAVAVRLVRCPKCHNLLPELPAFSIYKCGGCGAVLKAKKKGILDDNLSGISAEVKRGSIITASEVQMDSEYETERGRAGKFHHEGVVSNGSSKSRAETDSDVSRREERIRRREHFGSNHNSYPQGVFHRPENVNSHGGNAFNDIRTPIESISSRPFMDQWDVKSRGSLASPGRYNNFGYHDAGPSSYDTKSYYRHNERTIYPRRDMDELARVEELENGRAELLRKLDELKDQLSRSCDMTEKPKERIGTDPRMISAAPPDPYGRNRYAYARESLSNDMGAPYLREAHGFAPYKDRHGPNLRDPYPQRRYPNEFPNYANSYQPEMIQRPQSRYMHQPYNEQFHGYHGNVSHDLFMVEPAHQPSRSCLQCDDKNQHLPPKVDPSSLYNHRFVNEPFDLIYQHHQGPLGHGRWTNSSRGSNSYNSHSREHLAQNFTDRGSGNDGFNNYPPEKVLVAQGSGSVCRPVAGGAPFVACSNCFELLKIPKKRILLAKKHQKMKCGACSSVILFELGQTGCTVSAARVDHVPTEIDEGSSGTLGEHVRYHYGGSSSVDTTANDYDEAPGFSPTCKNSDSSESKKKMNHLSSSSSVSEDEKIPEIFAIPKHDSPTAELSLTVDKFSSQLDSSYQEHHDHISDNIVDSSFGKESESQRIEVDKVVFVGNASKQDSLRDGSVATEMDMSMNEFSTSCASVDSVERSKEYHPSVNGGGQSFFADVKGKSSEDFPRHDQHVEVGESQVYVNGRFIPDRDVKKAEKLAGPIQPGEYWYDILAGFWGVMGHPCLGIIMPNIEEFNYPLPDSCAAGNTGVFVNGRELHQKDLDVLVSRGLPSRRGGSYLITISGKVIDGYSGEELAGLGELAPTVERMKHGFGMKDPRFIAQLQN